MNICKSYEEEFIESTLIFFFLKFIFSLLLFVERLEPSGKSTVIASPSMFQNLKDTVVWMSDVDEFELKGDFMFTIKSISQVTV